MSGPYLSGPVRTVLGMSERFEMRVPEDLLSRLDAARGHEPRASFVKRALVEMLDVEPLTPVAAAAAREAYESPVLEEQFYAEDALAAIKGLESSSGCPECGGDMRGREPGVRACVDCGLTERM